MFVFYKFIEQSETEPLIKRNIWNILLYFFLQHTFHYFQHNDTEWNIERNKSLSCIPSLIRAQRHSSTHNSHFLQILCRLITLFFFSFIWFIFMHKIYNTKIYILELLIKNEKYYLYHLLNIYIKFSCNKWYNMSCILCYLDSKLYFYPLFTLLILIFSKW